MTTTITPRTITVALLGNPNTGKSTLFSALVGVRQQTGNYPGVTVEKKMGRTSLQGTSFQIVDLPGTYSLAPHSPDEMVTVDVLLGRQADVAQPDVVLCIVDASNLARNLYLVSQVLELQRPTVLALNMIDIAADKGITVDAARLQERLGVPVIPIRANRKQGLDELRAALRVAAEQDQRPPRHSPLPDAMQSELTALEALASHANGAQVPRYLLERLLLDTGYLTSAPIPGVTNQLRSAADDARQRLLATGQSLAAMETIARYQWVAQVTEGLIASAADPPRTMSDRLDRVLTHRVAGPVIFAVVMLLIFQAVFNGAVWFMDTIESLLGSLGVLVAGLVPDGAFQSLLVDGVIGGVGSVLVFLPQIFILFFFIALLEDCGYMARAAFLMDRLMARIGLSGKSFIPLLSSFACAVPGIMATRVIEDRRDRLVTILIAPLMTCSARLPVYILLIAAFIPNRSLVSLGAGDIRWSLGLQDVTMAGLYLLGIVAAVLVALLLKKTILPGETPPFVMELPSYKLPDLRIVLFRMVERGWAFVRRAGTLIFAVSVIVWAAGYFPRNEAEVEAPFVARRTELQTQMAQLESTEAGTASDEVAELQAELDAIDNQIAGAHIRQSYLGRAGHWIEPVVRPLGWDWRIGCAVVASFPAREVVVGTLGVIYNLGSDEGSQALRDSLRESRWETTGERVFNVPVALSIMVFFALCAQCVSTLAVIRRETNSWRWPIFSFVYMTVLAYVGALLTYQITARFWL
jgi:ferrous iron transport protein B